MSDDVTEFGRLLLGFIIIAAIFLGGAYIYQGIEGYTYAKSLYYVILTVTTVGAYTAGPTTLEGLWFSIIIVLAGMGVFLYVASQVGRIVLEGRIRNVLGRIRGEFAKMRKEKNHIIICGYTKLGEYAADTFEEEGEKYVIVEEDPNVTENLADAGKPVLQGDPLNEEILKKANIKKATGLVASMEEDADNMYLLMSAKDLNSDLILAARASDEAAVDRMHKVGAQIVVRPEVIGGQQLASSLMKVEEAGELETISTEETEVE